MNNLIPFLGCKIGKRSEYNYDTLKYLTIKYNEERERELNKERLK